MGRGVPLPVTGMLVMGNFFQTLGVQPSLGRLFTADEALPHSRPAVLLSHAFWKRQFGANLNIVGQAVNFDNTQVTVVGVLPDTFDFGSVFSPGAKVDVFSPYIMKDFEHDGNDLALVGRLKPGVTLGEAQAEADSLFPKLDLDLTHPEYRAEYTATLLTLKDYVSGQLRRSLIVLWCAVGLILLIVCVNLSNLLLARAAARSKEFAMRSALGAGRGRLVRQLLTESLVLSGVGAVLGLSIAFAVVTWLAHQGSIALPLLNSVRVDGAALGWTVLIAIAAAVFFGTVPALRISGGNLQEVLKDSGHGTSAGRKHDRMRSILVVSEVALACVLLVGAGLLLRSFLRVLDVDLGFQPRQAAAISVDYNDGADAAKRAAIWQEVVSRIEAIPGVEIAGITDNLPLSRNRSWGYQVKGQELSERGGYFRLPSFTSCRRGTSTPWGCAYEVGATSAGEMVHIVHRLSSSTKPLRVLSGREKTRSVSYNWAGDGRHPRHRRYFRCSRKQRGSSIPSRRCICQRLSRAGRSGAGRPLEAAA